MTAQSSFDTRYGNYNLSDPHIWYIHKKYVFLQQPLVHDKRAGLPVHRVFLMANCIEEICEEKTMILFHSDLDNTLIYSYKHDIGPDKRCVEIYQGKELSYMKPEWIEAIKRIRKKAVFVPTTTRTLEQYRRIEMGIDVPEYALVCNGGVLLKNGQALDAWYQESVRLVSDSREELDKAVELFLTDRERNFEVRFIEQLFVFTKSGKPEESVLRLKDGLDKRRVDVFSNGTKVYVVPKGLDKGTGTIRLRKLLGAEKSIAAGDSEFDKSMLLAADVGLCPDGLFLERQADVVTFPQPVFTNHMLKHLENMIG